MGEEESQLYKLHVALRALPSEAREVFLLRQNRGLAYEEIARLRRSPIETVKKQMRLALQELRKVLNSEL
jgi:DNA-directed RNA polymerase specialized sigma24 family protein